MPLVRMPDGQVVDVPENPTAEQRAFLARTQLESKGQQQQEQFTLPGEAFMPATGLEQIGKKIQGFAAPIVRRGAPAAAGALLGGLAGALGGPIAPVTVPLGIAMGGVAGEAIRQGITGERDPLALALQGIIPPAARLGAGATRIASRFGFRGPAAQELNVLGQQEAAAAISRLRSPVPVSQMFLAARQSGSQIPMTKFLQTADDVVKEAGKLSAEARKALDPVLKRITSIVDDAVTQGKVFTPDKLQAELEAFADLTKSIRRTGGQGGRFADKALGAMLSDLDDAAAQAAKNPALQGAQALLAARKGYLRNETINEMGEIIEQAFQVRRGMGGAAQFNPNQVLKGFQQNPFFEKAFTPQEQKEIFSLLKKINRIPVLPPPPGAEHGFGAVAKRFLAPMAFGTTAAARGGGPLEVGAAAAAGALAVGAARTARDLSVALQFKEGRALLSRLLAGTDGAITPQVAQLLGSFAATKLAEEFSQVVGP